MVCVLSKSFTYMEGIILEWPNAGAVTGYGSLSSYQRFLQYTLIHDFGFGHRIFPFPLQVMTSAIYQFPTCGTRPRDQWHMLLGNLV